MVRYGIRRLESLLFMNMRHARSDAAFARRGSKSTDNLAHETRASLRPLLPRGDRTCLRASPIYFQIQVCRRDAIPS